MKKEIKELLTQLTQITLDDYNITLMSIQSRAKAMLQEDFKEEVLTTFSYHLRNDKDFRKSVISHDKVDFINESKYYDDYKKFILDNWDDLDKILDILKEEIVPSEKEKSCTPQSSE